MTKAIAVIKDGWQVAWVDERGIGMNPNATGSFQVLTSVYLDEILKALSEAIEMCESPETASVEHTWSICNGEYVVRKHSWTGISIVVNYCRILLPAVPVHIAKAVYKASKKSYDKWINME